MFIDLSARLREPAVQQLIELSVFPDPERLELTIARYEDAANGLRLLGYESEGDLIGIVGFTIGEAKRMVLHHLAVLPEVRGAGFGRGMILELLHEYEPAVVEAETDEEAVHFYRSIGFRVESVGERYPGAERFLCTYEAEESAD